MFTAVSPFPPAREHIRTDEIVARSFIGQYARMAIPDGEFEKMIRACGVYMLMALTDDWVEKHPRDKGGSTWADRAIGIIRDELGPNTESPIDVLTNQIFRGIQASTTAEQYTQFSLAMSEFLRTTAEPPVLQNVAQLLDYRSIDIGGYFALALNRYAAGIYITDDELQNPLLLVIPDAVSMENDVASYEKEVEDGTLGSNLVAFLVRHGIDGYKVDTPSVAKALIREWITICEAKLQDAISTALADPVLGKSDTIRRYHGLMGYWTPSCGAHFMVPRTNDIMNGSGEALSDHYHLLQSQAYRRTECSGQAHT
ncbi:hypothetical protein B0H14DRAFT_3429930 [Mycena olivaceomarginata]|nr:hypothetical protein B0H14DRAFT_3429930 [Mycena olivaceomarginata]